MYQELLAIAVGAWFITHLQRQSSQRDIDQNAEIVQRLASQSSVNRNLNNKKIDNGSSKIRNAVVFDHVMYSTMSDESIF